MDAGERKDKERERFKNQLEKYGLEPNTQSTGTHL